MVGLIVVAPKDKSIGEGETANFVEVKEYFHDFDICQKLDYDAVFDVVANAEDYIPKSEASDFVSDNPPDIDEPD